MEPMESPNFLEHAEPLDENTPHYLNAFHKYLIQHNMSPNTITAYIYSVRHFFRCRSRRSGSRGNGGSCALRIKLYH